MSVIQSVTEPSAKTGYTVLAGAVVTILFSIITTTTGFVPDPELVGAAVVLATALISLLVPAKSGKYVDLEADRLDWDYERDGRMVDYATEPDGEPATLTEEDGA